LRLHCIRQTQESQDTAFADPVDMATDSHLDSDELAEQCSEKEMFFFNVFSGGV